MNKVKELNTYLEIYTVQDGISFLHDSKDNTISAVVTNNKIMNKITMFCNNNGLKFSLCQNVIIVREVL